MIDCIKRNYCVVCKNKNSDVLHIFKNFPIFMGARQGDGLEYHDQKWMICKSCGCIYLGELIPLEILYKYSHNGGIGPSWNKHYEKYAEYIQKYCGTTVAEIGSGNCRLAEHILKQNNDVLTYDMYDKNNNECVVKNDKIIFLDTFYNPNDINQTDMYETIISSHFVEHMYDPHEYFKSFHRILKKNGKVIYSFPNITAYLKNGLLTLMHFEHSYLVDDNYLKYMMENNGFKLLDVTHYSEYNIFMTFEKTDDILSTTYCNNYDENKNMYLSCIEKLMDDNMKIISEINKYSNKFLFSCHYNSQILLNGGLDVIKFNGVLDNDDKKHHKKLYGYDLLTYPIDVLHNMEDVVVVVKMGIYTDEICESIKNVNNNVVLML